MSIKIGDIVLYTAEGPPQDPRSAIPKVDPDYPAIVYKLYPNTDFLGLYVFTDEGVRLMRKVTWSITGEPTPETWRRKI